MMRCKKKYLGLLTLLAVFFLIYPGNLGAKKKGAHLVVEKQDGQFIEGELLSVRENSLLLMTPGSGTGVTIDINEIEKIKIKRKNKSGKGALIGAGACLLIGAVVGANSDFGSETAGGNLGVIAAVPGALIGGIIGAMIPGSYKTIPVKGKSPSKIKKIMEQLKKKARFEEGK